MKVLVTGGAGYLGGRLSRALLEKNHEVKIFDINKTKYVPPAAEFIKGDIRNCYDVVEAVKYVDAVFHLAFVQTPSTLPENIQYEVNVVGTRNLLDALVGHELKRFIFISTIEVYGSKPSIPITEGSAIDPVGIYGLHKMQCEELCLEYSHSHNLPCTIARLPLICGQGYYNHKAFLNILDRIIDHKWIVLPSDGRILADMIHIDDALEALLLLLTNDRAIGEIFHFSASKVASHDQMARTAIEAVNSKSKIFYIPSYFVRIVSEIILRFGIFKFPREQIDYMLNDFVCSNDKAINLLGYKPAYSVLDAIIELVKGYQADRDFIRGREIGDGL